MPNQAPQKPFLPARYVWETTLDDVVHKELTVGGRKNSDGTSELFTESRGWYFIFDGMALNVGDVKPSFQKGDKIRLLIERMP